MRIHPNSTIAMVLWRRYERALRPPFPKNATGSRRLRRTAEAFGRPIRHTNRNRRHPKLQGIHESFRKRRIVGHIFLLIASARGLWRSEERRVGKECRSRWSP